MQRKIGISWLTIALLIISILLSFTIACGKKTDQAKKHFNLALQYEEQKMPQEALKEYRQAIQLDPGLADAHFRLGALYHTLNSFAAAIGEYQKVLQINPNYPGIHTALAHAYYVRGMNAWVRAMNLDQLTYMEADTLRSLSYRDKAELNKSIEEYQNTVRADTSDAATFSKLSQAFYILAVEEYQKGIQANPSDTAAMLYLALTYSEQGYPQKAALLCDALTKVDPRAANVLQTMLQQKEKEKLYYDELRKRQK